MKPRLLWLVSALALAFCAAPFRQIPAFLDPSNPEGPEGAPAQFLVSADEKNEPLSAAPVAQNSAPGHPESHTLHASDVAPAQQPAAHSPQNPSGNIASVSERDAAKESAAQYICPMHPDVVRTEPGKCPKCGMKLVLQKTPPAGSKTSPDPAPANNGAGHDMHMHGAEGSKP